MLKDISYNNFVGAIPEEIGNISGLTEMIFGYNNLTGTIPLELLQLQKLEVFELFHNNLSGTLPSFLGNLTSLCRLVSASSVLNSE